MGLGTQPYQVGPRNPHGESASTLVASRDVLRGPFDRERQGFHHYDGFAWYRKTFVLPQELGDEELVLLLGKIDDFDQTYVNGYLVGATKDYKPYGLSFSHTQLRAYYVPRDILKPGEENVIAVRVEDMGNVGGIYQGPIGLVKQSKFTRFWRYR